MILSFEYKLNDCIWSIASFCCNKLTEICVFQLTLRLNLYINNSILIKKVYLHMSFVYSTKFYNIYYKYSVVPLTHNHNYNLLHKIYDSLAENISSNSISLNQLYWAQYLPHQLLHSNHNFNSENRLNIYNKSLYFIFLFLLKIC